MSYYRVCPLCGCHLDPDERCDCREKEKRRPGLQHRDGKGGNVCNDSASSVTKFEEENKMKELKYPVTVEELLEVYPCKPHSNAGQGLSEEQEKVLTAMAHSLLQLIAEEANKAYYAALRGEITAEETTVVQSEYKDEDTTMERIVNTSLRIIENQRRDAIRQGIADARNGVRVKENH